MQLGLTNYQSWSRANLKVEGLTVVVGPSNRGKSSFARAFVGALRNEIGPQHIKLGATEPASVKLDIDGHNILASRGLKAKDSLVYTVDGQDYSKLQGGIPESIAALNFGPVNINGTVIDPTFAGQFAGQFLLGNSPAEFNQVMMGFANTERLDKGRKVLASSILEINAQAKALTPRISHEQQQVADLTARCENVEALQVTVNALAKLVAGLQKAVNAVKVLATAKTVLAAAQVKLQALDVLHDRLYQAVARYKQARQVGLARQAKLNHIALTLQVSVLDAVKDKLKAAGAALKAPKAIGEVIAAQAKATLLTTQQAALLAVEGKLNRALVLYKATFRTKLVAGLDPEGLRARAAAAQDLTNPILSAGRLAEAHIITMKLQTTVLPALGRAQDDLSGLDTDMKAVVHEREQVEQAIDQLRASAVICPSCGAEFIPNHAH